MMVMNEPTLPEELVQVLPSDPFEQLDLARKIMSVALATRVNALQSESSILSAELANKDATVAELQSEVDSLYAAISEAEERFAKAEEEKERLVTENASLSNTVRKLTRDVSKLQVFKRTLMQSFQEEEENSGGAVAAKLQSQTSITSSTFHPEVNADNDASLPPSRSSSMQAYISETGNSVSEDQESDAARPRVPYNFLLASQTSTPRVTPPGSPPSLSASVSPTRSSKPVSPIRRHSVSFSSSRGIYDDRSSVFSSSGSVSSTDTLTQTGRTRVDGKEFFRQVRSRLSNEQFGALLANVKELNSHKQTKAETLQKVDEIFGSENKDLYAIFEGLITRNVH
ncbi:PREDICTED: uncharacterized protein At4g15545-like isoform X2 [Lupinus angustifolius]|uniref:uncharacterized protein At4g15545-like isoform X2 n=1 Tax=Lupinus angustifolius TaxID=3871 RepID=UPI00092EFFC8|nr:PREDICTED: uncharacterized protein At4g15545-like isoform X2 [Lupinus angustifolius]